MRRALEYEHMFDPFDDVEAALDKLASTECDVDVVRVQRAIERLQCRFLRSVRAAERAGEWQADGFVSTAAWLRAQCNLTPRPARSSVTLARTLESLPLTSEAFAAGEITRTHVEVLARAARPELADVEAPLLEVARNANPVALRQVVQQVTDALDGDGDAARANEQFERREVFLSSTLDGMGALNGTLDAEATEFMQTAFDTVIELTRRAADPRTRAAARRCPCRAGEGRSRPLCQGPGAAHPAAHLARGRRGGPLSDGSRRSGPYDPRRRRTLGRLSAATIERFACDAGITRVSPRAGANRSMSAAATRVISNALWRALVARDRGCVEPGCDRPPGWCEVHHKFPGHTGGLTNPANCELRCWQHHRDEHEGRERAP